MAAYALSTLRFLLPLLIEFWSGREKMNAKQRHTLFARLQAQNPHPTTELHYQTPFELLSDESRQAGHVPQIEHNPRNGEQIELAPHEASRYQERSGAERPNSHLKDNRGGRMG